MIHWGQSEGKQTSKQPLSFTMSILASDHVIICTSGREKEKQQPFLSTTLPGAHGFLATVHNSTNADKHNRKRKQNKRYYYVLRTNMDD